jgi:hypothetical protein
MRFAVGLSALVVVMGLASVVLNLHHLGLVLVSVAGMVCALVPLVLLRWIMRRGMTAGGVLRTAARDGKARTRSAR